MNPLDVNMLEPVEYVVSEGAYKKENVKLSTTPYPVVGRVPCLELRAKDRSFASVKIKNSQVNVGEEVRISCLVRAMFPNFSREIVCALWHKALKAHGVRSYELDTEISYWGRQGHDIFDSTVHEFDGMTYHTKYGGATAGMAMSHTTDYNIVNRISYFKDHFVFCSVVQAANFHHVVYAREHVVTFPQISKPSPIDVAQLSIWKNKAVTPKALPAEYYAKPVLRLLSVEVKRWKL